MSEISGILDALYANESEAVIVFASSGDVLWENESACSFLSKTKSVPEQIYLCVKAHPEKSGYFSADKLGGKFRVSVIGNTECWIVELFSEDTIVNLFYDHRVTEFACQNDASIRNTVTDISASCNYIRSNLSDSSKAPDIDNVLNNVLSSCRRLLRTSAVSSVIAEIVKESMITRPVIRLDSFLREFADGCRNTLTDSCEVILNENPECSVCANYSLLRYWLLLLLRNMLHASERKTTKIEISSSIIDDKAEIIFALTKGIPIHGSYIHNMNDMEFDEISLELFADRLGAEYDFTENALKIRLRLTKDDSDYMKSPCISFGDDVFSPFRFMLDDYKFM
ncbi:MAG: hypothetical protein IJX77_10705 [Ruminococcus sp.]|nr:hypothetical protein [Ruminococcus sp.]